MQNFALVKTTQKTTPLLFVKFVLGGFTCPSGKRPILPLSNLGGKIVERFESKKACDLFLTSHCDGKKHPFDVLAEKYADQ